MAAGRQVSNSVNLRLPRRMLERADALREALVHAPELAILPSVTRSDVLRLCMLKGLEVLEERHEAAIDQELGEEADRRLTDPESRERIPWAQVKAESDL